MGMHAPDDESPFEVFIEVNDNLIRRLARDARWRIPYQETEETEADLAVTLWQAYLNHKPGRGSFQAYFNTLWARLKGKRVRDAMRDKRSVLVVVVPLPEQDEAAPVAYEHARYVPLPVHGIDPLEESVWTLLQVGYEHADVIHYLPITLHRYLNLIRVWKNNDVIVKDVLGGGG